jgi:hypothetical protein
MAVSVTFRDARISSTPCAYHPDNTVARVHYIVVSSGIILAYCDTEAEAEAMRSALNSLADSSAKWVSPP